MKAIEGDVVAFREVMEWVCEFGIVRESRLATPKLSLEQPGVETPRQIAARQRKPPYRCPYARRNLS